LQVSAATLHEPISSARPVVAFDACPLSVSSAS
jgi:hypothetical protein